MSGDLRDARGLDDRRFALAIGKPSGLVLIGVNAAEPFAIRIENGYQPVVMLSSFVRVERLLFASRGLLRCFFHLASCLEAISRHYRKNHSLAQVPIQLVTRSQTIGRTQASNWMRHLAL